MPELNPVIADRLSSMNLPSSVERQVEKTILRYSKSGSFCQKLKNIFFSIFGQSDWQRAKRAYAKSSLDKAEYDLSNRPYTEVMRGVKQIKKRTNSLQKKYLDQGLKIAVKIQNNEKVSFKEVKNLNKTLNKINSILEEISI